MADLPAYVASLLPLLVGVVLLALAAFVLRAHRDRVFNVVFAVLYTLSGLKSVSEGLLPLAGGFHAAAPAFPAPAFWFGLNFLCAAFMIPLLALFVLLFPRPARFLARAPSAGLLLFAPSTAFVAIFAARPAGVDLATLALLLNATAVAATVAAVALLLRTLRSSADPIERARARYVLYGFAPAFAGTWLVSGLEFLAVAGVATPRPPLFVNYVLPLLELVAAAATAYAIVKYQLLGIELQVKVGLKYVLTVAILVVGLFLTKEAFEQVIEPFFAFTSLSYLLTALVGTLVFRPIERAATRLTNLLFPATAADPNRYQADRARQVYHAQAAYVLRDARVTERERNFLDHLRQQLGLTAEEAGRIELDVVRLLGADLPSVAGPARAAGP